MNSSIPDISVVIPAFNEEDYLPQALEAVKKQQFSGTYEVIVVNNNSTDKSEQIAKTYGATIVQEKNQGLIFAKQAGCKAARGNIIAVLDADNRPNSHWLATISKLLANTHIAGVTGPYIIPHQAPWWARAHTIFFMRLIYLYQSIFGTSPHVWGGNIAFRKKDFFSFGGYDTRFTFAADEVKLRKQLSKLGPIIQVADLALVSSTRRYKKGLWYFYIEFLLKGYLLNYFLTAFFKKPLPHPAEIRQEF